MWSRGSNPLTLGVGEVGATAAAPPAPGLTQSAGAPPAPTLLVSGTLMSPAGDTQCSQSPGRFVAPAGASGDRMTWGMGRDEGAAGLGDRWGEQKQAHFPSFHEETTSHTMPWRVSCDSRVSWVVGPRLPRQIQEHRARLAQTGLSWIVLESASESRNA